MKKEIRKSNFELMRMVSMFFIVIYHFLVPTGGNLIHNSSYFTSLILRFISLLIIVHVNSFVMLTGYFGYNKKTKLTKTFKLLLTSYFYFVLVYGIFYLVTKNSYSYSTLFEIISPFEYPNMWFLKLYVILYLLAPYINILIDKLNQNQHKYLLILMYLVFSVLTIVSRQRFYYNNGNTLIHFIGLYLLGSFLHKYPVSQSAILKNASKMKMRLLYIILFFFMAIFNFLLYEFSRNISCNMSSIFIKEQAEFMMQNIYFYHFPTVIIQSVVYFLLFETFNIKSKIINIIANPIFTVYLITEQPIMINFLYSHLKERIYHIDILPKILIYSIIILFSCIIIDYIRKLIIKTIINVKKTLFGK